MLKIAVDVGGPHTDLDETQLAYLPGNNLRIRVRVAGELRL